jgi:hypothetical protein
MKYPESWERDVAAWVNEAGDYGDVVVTHEDNGPAVHHIKGKINWIATISANWKSLLVTVASVAAVVSLVVALVRAVRKK